MKRQILLVDDDTDLVAAISNFLKNHDFQVVTALDVREAQLKLKNQKFHCIITDIRLKDESGEDLIESIRGGGNKELNRESPILVISGFLDRTLAERLKNQVSGALVKPFSMETLLQKLEAAIG